MSNRVQDRLTVVDFDALDRVRAVPVHKIGAGIQSKMRELFLIFLRDVLIA